MGQTCGLCQQPEFFPKKRRRYDPKAPPLADTWVVDEIAGRLTNMFDFTHKRNERIFLDPMTREVTSIKRDANNAE